MANNFNNDQSNFAQIQRTRDPPPDPIHSIEENRYLTTRTSRPVKIPWVPAGPTKTPPFPSQLEEAPVSTRGPSNANNSVQDLSSGSNGSSGPQVKLIKLSETIGNQTLQMSFNGLVHDVQGWQAPMNRRVQIAVEILNKLKLHYNRRKSVTGPEAGLRCLADLSIYRVVAGRLLVEGQN